MENLGTVVIFVAVFLFWLLLARKGGGG